jgi:hypothetical protein
MNAISKENKSALNLHSVLLSLPIIAHHVDVDAAVDHRAHQVVGPAQVVVDGVALGLGAGSRME